VPTDLEAWGLQKNTYMFKDLEEFFKRMRGRKGKESSGKNGDKKKSGKAA